MPVYNMYVYIVLYYIHVLCFVNVYIFCLGVCLCFHVGSNHYGIAGYYSLMALKKGLIVSTGEREEGNVCGGVAKHITTCGH